MIFVLVNSVYNYFRDYDPTIGRYLESDPIGLDGGENTYVYALDNPLFYSDVYGLVSNCTQCKRDCNMIFEWDNKGDYENYFENEGKCRYKLKSFGCKAFEIMRHQYLIEERKKQRDECKEECKASEDCELCQQ